LLTGRRLFNADSEAELLARILTGDVERPSRVVSDVPPILDDVVMRGLASNPADRFLTARAMATAFERAVPVASAAVVADWVRRRAGAAIAARAARVAVIEREGAPVETSAEALPSKQGSGDDEPPQRSKARSRSAKRFVAATLGVAASLVSVVAFVRARPPRTVVGPKPVVESVPADAANEPGFPGAAESVAPAPPPVGMVATARTQRASAPSNARPTKPASSATSARKKADGPLMFGEPD
jgi:serine/threonine-protein kinase